MSVSGVRVRACVCVCAGVVCSVGVWRTHSVFVCSVCRCSACVCSVCRCSTCVCSVSVHMGTGDEINPKRETASGTPSVDLRHNTKPPLHTRRRFSLYYYPLFSQRRSGLLFSVSGSGCTVAGLTEIQPFARFC